MVKTTCFLAAYCMLSLMNCAEVGNHKAETFECDYPSQKLPGDSLEIFASGLISSNEREHSCPTFSPDGTEIYFSRTYGEDRHDIFLIKEDEDGFWSFPELFSFTSEYLDDGAVFSPDGSRLFFGSRRPLTKRGNPKNDTDIWYIEKTDEGWSEPVRLGAPVNSEQSEGFPSFSDNSFMYFHSSRNGEAGNSEIYRAKFENGSFSEPEKLSSKINTSFYEAAPFIAPDESFIIYYRINMKERSEKGLMINFRQSDGSWSETVNLGEYLNLVGNDLLMAKTSPDGKYLFVLDQGDIFWIKADIIERLRAGL